MPVESWFAAWELIGRCHDHAATPRLRRRPMTGDLFHQLMSLPAVSALKANAQGSCFFRYMSFTLAGYESHVTQCSM